MFQAIKLPIILRCVLHTMAIKRILKKLLNRRWPECVSTNTDNEVILCLLKETKGNLLVRYYSSVTQTLAI